MADYDKVIDINVKAVFVAVLEVVKHLKAGGRIITIGSNMGDTCSSAGPISYQKNRLLDIHLKA
nr:SDR family NAD(P)-dependent oxidoreductase [Chitinophaga pinensis]